MASAFLITLREGLEAALVVGIVLGYLRHSGRRAWAGYAWAGVASAVFLSGLLVVALRMLGKALEKPYAQIFEGTTMLLAVAVLTWMIVWMRRQGQLIKRDLESWVQGVLARGEQWGLFGLTFLAVFREGVETALFLSASAFTAEAASHVSGALLGLACAVGIGGVIYTSTRRLNVKLFFDVTGVLLIVFAAGLLAHGVHEFQEIGWLPLTRVAWNTQWLLDHQAPFGSLVRSLTGYTAQPTWLELVVYLGYWGIVGLATYGWTRRTNPMSQKKM